MSPPELCMISQIHQDLLSDNDTVNKMQRAIQDISDENVDQRTLDVEYDNFCELVIDAIKSHTNYRTIQINKSSNKKRRIRKPRWTDELSQLWNTFCDAEKQWTRADTVHKRTTKQRMKDCQRVFDRAVQRAKRGYWRTQQEYLLSLPQQNPGEFWKYIGRIGVGNERSARNIPMEVVLDDQRVSTNTQTVMNKWRDDFCELLNPVNDPIDAAIPTFDPVRTSLATTALNQLISADEISMALRNSKRGKAVGCDDIPVEALANPQAITYLTELFNKCWTTGLVPHSWKSSIINPIPKCATADRRVPLNYRGISLASSVYKLYCSVINDRLTAWAENNELLCDEQNGFRKGRGCVDHLASLNSLISTRKQQRKSTFACFVDFSKAYDRIDRRLLWTKLETLGLHGNILRTLKQLYTGYKCCVRLNGISTDYFDVLCGLKQGCILSPLLFNIYINDLVDTLNRSGCGIKLDNDRISCLLYADDIALLAENEKDLQDMLDIVHTWCCKWKMKINYDKTQIVHFRPDSRPRSASLFVCGDKTVQLTDKYKYLGLIFTEHLNYDVMAKTVSDAANRALGLLIAKFKMYGGMPFDVFTKLYEALVLSIVNYGSSIWGNREFSCINSIHNKACRTFLGVGRYTPNSAVQGDMGWKMIYHTIWINMCKQWCRSVNMDHDRINKRIFIWCYNQCSNNVKNWTYHVNKVFNKFNMSQLYNNINEHLTVTNVINNAEANIFEYFNEKWYLDVNREHAVRGQGRNKLRTYKLFKNVFETELYVKQIMSRAQRSALARFRCGVAPLRLETGRYERNRLPAEERICTLCNSGVEDECHVLMKCPLYCDIRNEMFLNVQSIDGNFIFKNEQDQFVFLLRDPRVVHVVARTLHDILKRRQSFISNITN